MMRISGLAAALIVLPTFAFAQTQAFTEVKPPSVSTPVSELNFTIKSVKNTTIGTGQLRGSAHGVILRVAIQPGGLKPGWHGIHFHNKPDCAADSGFKSAGAHVNHSNKKHGFLNPEGADNGNLPNLYAAADGSAKGEFFSNLVRLEGDETALARGAALVIHEGEDDHTTQPIGGSGARVACGVIKR